MSEPQAAAQSLQDAPATEIELPNGIKIRVPATNAEALRTAILAGHEVCQAVSPC